MFRAVAATTVALVLSGGCTVSQRQPATEPQQTPVRTPTPTQSVADVAFTATHEFADGISVRVSEVTFARLGQFQGTDDPNATPGDPYAIVTLSWTNSSDADIRLSPLTYVYVGAGGREANRVDYGDNPDEITPRPNETMTYDVAFLVSATDRDRVVLDVSDAMDPSHLVRFRGALR